MRAPRDRERSSDRSEVRPQGPYVLFERGGAVPQTLIFENPVKIFSAQTAEQAREALVAMEAARREGHHLAGYAAYDLGYVLEPRLAAHGVPQGTGPLLRFGAFAAPRRTPTDQPPRAAQPEIILTPAWSLEDYRARFLACIDYIFAGDVYQINLTFPLRGRFAGDPIDLYRALRLRQPVAFGGVATLGPETIVSLSPEMFFETDGRNIRTRPMKGTARRGRSPEEDAAQVKYLREDPKNRAENLMIVDLLRNDLSRLSEIGSVKVTDLYTVETYPTLHQMTSGIEARLREGVTLPQLFTGLFPCGSVTGAPKIRAMEIIKRLEGGPRGAYCGSLGMIAPDGKMAFNVAIRTLTLAPDGGATYNVGSAVVADSRPEEEYAECLMKAGFLTRPTSP